MIRRIAGLSCVFFRLMQLSVLLSLSEKRGENLTAQVVWCFTKFTGLYPTRQVVRRNISVRGKTSVDVSPLDACAKDTRRRCGSHRLDSWESKSRRLPLRAIGLLFSQVRDSRRCRTFSVKHAKAASESTKLRTDRFPRAGRHHVMVSGHHALENEWPRLNTLRVRTQHTLASRCAGHAVSIFPSTPFPTQPFLKQKL